MQLYKIYYLIIYIYMCIYIYIYVYMYICTHIMHIHVCACVCNVLHTHNIIHIFTLIITVRNFISNTSYGI